MRRFLPRLTYANVIASLALFIALGGAAVAAGLPKNSVGPNQIKKGAVTSKALRNKAVTAGKIAPKAVTAGKLGANAVLPGNLGAGIISTDKISASAVTAEKIKNNVVTTNKLNNKAVTAAKIADSGIATSNLAEGAVTAAKLGKSAVTAEKLAPEVLNNVLPLKSTQTERGVFDIGGTKATAKGKAFAARGAISLQQPLAANPSFVLILLPGATSPQCPGLGGGGTTPEATAGTLCIYMTTATGLSPTSSLTAESSSRLGTGLVANADPEAEVESNFVASGVWAVTAP
jgi:hypothetical protein